jgi:hypothetical protein
MTTIAASSSLQALLERLVDYAGLFPPATLSMREAVANFASYRASPDAWMLGRFVVPIARLDELAREAATLVDERQGPWTVSAIVSADPAGDSAAVRAFNGIHRGRLVVDAVELRAATPEAIDWALPLLDRELTVFVEIPFDVDPRDLLETIKRHEAGAKVRTGGITADLFPSARELARFIASCAALELPFKATAGLHHPLRSEQRLTYEPGASTATMFGFLNVFLAAAFARAGMHESQLVRLLEERDVGAFTFRDDAVTWREHRLDREQLADARHSFAVGFGSCSFREPVDDLRQLGLL